MKWVRTEGRAGQLVPSFLLGARGADSNPGGARGLTQGWSPRGVQEDQSLSPYPASRSVLGTTAALQSHVPAMGHSSSLWTISAGVSSGGHRCILFGAQNPREPSSDEGVSREGVGPALWEPFWASHRRPAQVGVMCVLPKRRYLLGKKPGLKETSQSTLPVLTRAWRAGDGDLGCFLALHQEPQGRAPVLAQGLDPGVLALLEGLVHRHPLLKQGSCPPRAAERTFHAMSAGEPWGPWRASVALGALLDGSAGGRWWGPTELRTQLWVTAVSRVGWPGTWGRFIFRHNEPVCSSGHGL